MADRVKMSRVERAKQFAPFDALKGLSAALKIKEYENEKINKREVSEEDAKQISSVLMNLKNKDKVNVEFFFDGYEREVSGPVKMDVLNGKIIVSGKEIEIIDIVFIEKV